MPIRANVTSQMWPSGRAKQLKVAVARLSEPLKSGCFPASAFQNVRCCHDTPDVPVTHVYASPEKQTPPDYNSISSTVPAHMSFLC